MGGCLWEGVLWLFGLLLLGAWSPGQRGGTPLLPVDGGLCVCVCVCVCGALTYTDGTPNCLIKVIIIYANHSDLDLY